MKIMIKNAKLLDVSYDYEEADVLIQDEKILQIGKDLVEDDAQVIDLKGMTLMPAFADNHVHIKSGPGEFDEKLLEALVYNGVSFVKDLGILDTIELEGYATWLKSQDAPGKCRVATAGRYIDVKDGYGAGPVPGECWGMEIETPQEAADKVSYQYKNGVNGIKIGMNDGGMGPILGKLNGNHIKAITDRAKSLGIWTTAHVYAMDDLRLLVDNGIGEAAHTVHDREIDDDIIQKMVLLGIPMTTTIGNDDENTPLPDRYPPVYESAQAFMDKRLRDKEMTLRNLKKFYEKGGTITIGTDLMHLSDPMKQAVIPTGELAQLVQVVGMSVKDAIKAGTVNAAASCGFDDEGAIRPGNRANLIAFAGKLEDDFKQLLDLRFVMNRGRIIRQ